MESRLEVKRGDVWMIDLGEQRGSIQGNLRPCLTISNNACNLYSPVITIIPLSSNVNKRRLPTHVYLGQDQGLIRESIALCEQIQSVDKNKLKYKVAQVDEKTIQQIEKAAQVQLGIETYNYSEILKKIMYLMKNIAEIESHIENKRGMNSYNIQLDMYKHELNKVCSEIGVTIDNQFFTMGAGKLVV